MPLIEKNYLDLEVKNIVIYIAVISSMNSAHNIFQPSLYRWAEGAVYDGCHEVHT